MTANTKICAKCKIAKTIDSFNKLKVSKDGYHSQCRVCCSQYYKKNRDEILKKQSQYYQDNKDEIRERTKEYSRKYAKEYYWKNRDSILEKNKTDPIVKEKRKIVLQNWRKNNPEKFKEQQQRAFKKQKEIGYPNVKKFYQNHKHEILENKKQNKEHWNKQNREYRKRNPEKMRVVNLKWNLRRRGYLSKVVGEITDTDIKRILFKQRDKCYWCNKHMDKFTVDHFIPLSRNGKHEIANIVLCCQSCNSSKKNQHPYDFAIKINKDFQLYQSKLF